MKMGGPPAAHEPRARWRAQIADSCRVLQLEWRQIWVMTLLWVLAQMPAMVYMTLAAPFGDELFQGAEAGGAARASRRDGAALAVLYNQVEAAPPLPLLDAWLLWLAPCPWPRPSSFTYAPRPPRRIRSTGPSASSSAPSSARSPTRLTVRAGPAPAAR